MELQDTIAHILQDAIDIKNRAIGAIKEKSTSYIGWIVVVGIVSLGIIGWISQTPKANTPRVEGISVTAASPSATIASTAAVKVDVSGAVNQPGVKELQAGDRVEDALRAAGGIASTADSEYVAMNINLAAKVQDGDKIFIPLKGQSIGENPTSVPSVGTKSTSIAGSGGKVSINHASASELDGLPGIGATYAARIIGGRPYKSVDDLCNRSDIFRSKSTCDKIRSLVTL